MGSQFLECLAVTLAEETGYPQPVGGPYLRHANGATHIPTAADDRFFSNDPDDTGGRTGAGILQREYDPWRRARGLPAQDVWRISDAELHALYREQYWQAVNGDALPAGVALFVFDFGVHCGVGTAISRLQIAVGVKPDCHLGAVTLAAVRAADPVELVRKLKVARERYHRRCTTFWKHGNNWLARTARVAKIAETRATRFPVLGFADADTAPALDPTRPTAPRATLAPEPDSMLQSSTGNVAVVGGGSTLFAAWTHFATTLQRIAERGEPVTVRAVVLELATDPVAVAMVAALGAAVFVWFERRRKMRAT